MGEGTDQNPPQPPNINYPVVTQTTGEAHKNTNLVKLVQKNGLFVPQSDGRQTPRTIPCMLENDNIGPGDPQPCYELQN